MKTDITIKSITEAGHDEDDAPMVLALCEHLDCTPGELSREKYNHYGLAIFSQGSREYAIGTDSEADKAAQAYIRDSAWAFNASFLAGFTQLPESIFKAMQGECEGSNDAVIALIEHNDTFENFASEAISADGRGHFLSGYDGNEDEQEVFAPRLANGASQEDLDAFYAATNGAERITFYIYRIN